MAYRDPLGAALMMPSALSAHQFQVLGQQEFLMQLAAAAQQGRLGHPGLFMPPAFFQSAQIPLNQHFMPHLVAQTQACGFAAGPLNQPSREAALPTSSGSTHAASVAADDELEGAGRALQMLSAAAWREASPSCSEDETHSASRKRRAAPVREVDDFISAVPSKAARVLAEDIEEAAERRRTCSEASTDEGSDDDDTRSSSRMVPERRSERASGRLSPAHGMSAPGSDPAAGADRGYKDGGKEWAALTTWLRMNLHQPRTAKREVLFLGVREASGKWVFRLNHNISWDDVSPETKTRLRTLVSEASAAYQRKYPKRPKEHWRTRTQKYRPPGAARTHLVPLSDLVRRTTRGLVPPPRTPPPTLVRQRRALLAAPESQRPLPAPPRAQLETLQAIYFDEQPSEHDASPRAASEAPAEGSV